MKSSILIAAIATSLLVSLAGSVLAHDGVMGSETNPIEFPDWSTVNVVHENEQYPWKGTAFIYVKNTGPNAWGDFHFQIWSWNGDDISTVDFKDASMGGMDPISSQGPLSWSIDNNVVGATLDLYFYSDPVQPGQVATFQLYTDNTVGNVQFGLAMAPTAVPEPSSLLALSGSILGLAGLAWRRRR